MTFKPGDNVRIRTKYYLPALDPSLVHVIHTQLGGDDRYSVYCVGYVIWEDTMVLVNAPATCLLCLAHDSGVTTLGEDIDEAQRRIATAMALPHEFIYGKKAP